MTSTIKVNTITTESGSTLTVGGCGKTVALASGASQTGFGRTGTVDWETTKKTLLLQQLMVKVILWILLLQGQ